MCGGSQVPIMPMYLVMVTGVLEMLPRDQFSFFGLASNGRYGGAILDYYTYKPGPIPEGIATYMEIHDKILYWFTDMPVNKPNDSCDEECVVSFGSSFRVGWPVWPYCQ